MLQYDGNVFREEIRSNRINALRFISICSVPENFVLSIGGQGSSATVECHDVAANTWNNFYSLNEGRSSSSSCLIANKIYVFCGKG